MKSLLTAFIFVGLSIYAAAQTTVNGSFKFGGIKRSYFFHVPASYSADKPTALVFNLHGYGNNGSQQQLYSNFNAVADTAGFIVVYPEGSPEPLTGSTFWNFGVIGATVDDVGFLEALIDTIAAHYNIDLSRVYSTGISNGASMCYYLACHSTRFAAIASVAGSMSRDMYNHCNPSHPIPVLDIRGTADPIAVYNGDAATQGIEDVIQFWVNKNSCAPVPDMTQVPNTNLMDGATAEHYVYSGGTEGHTVEFFKVINGGHTWPGASIILPLGNTCWDFDASVEIWRFFNQYPKPLVTQIHQPTDDWNTYPNPATDWISIESPTSTGDFSLTVSDIQGRILQRSKIHIIFHLQDLNQVFTGY